MYIPTEEGYVDLHEKGWLNKGRGILWHTSNNTYEEAEIIDESRSDISFSIKLLSNGKTYGTIYIERVFAIKVTEEELEKLRKMRIWKW